MKNLTILIGALAVIAFPATAKERAAHVWPQNGVETEIAFANHDSIRNFEADGDDGVWLEDRQRRWYYAALLGPCTNLNFAHAIGYDTRGSSTFDRFSTIYVGGQRCQVTSLVTADKPKPWRERKKAEKAAREAAKAAAATPAN
ncbi:MAG: hypothetical protein RLZZ58_995 [Pseudomonadota bacterium]|jgi:hypothetical protein